MRQIRKILSVVAVLAITLMIYLGIPNQAVAILSPPSNLTIIDIDPSIIDINQYSFVSGLAYSFISPVVLNTNNILLGEQLTFNGLTAAGPVNQMSAIEGVTFLNDLTLNNGPTIVDGNTVIGITGGASLVSLGYVAPTPHPPKDEAFGALLTDQLVAMGITGGAGLVSLGYVAPTPHPPKDEMFGWASSPVIVDGTLDLTNATLNVDNFVSGFNNWQTGDFITIFGATGSINGTPALSGALANGWAYFDPGNEFGNTAGIVFVAPEPSTILLLGAGLLGLAGIGIMRRRKTAA